MTAVLDQRLCVPYNLKLSWVKKELTIKQKQLSQLATPGELTAYEIKDGKILVPKAWGLTHQDKLGVREIQDNQFASATVDCPIVIDALRPHQTEALKAICDEFTSNPLGGGGVLVLPCKYHRHLNISPESCFEYNASTVLV